MESLWAPTCHDEDGLDHCSHQREMEGIHNDYSTLSITMNKQQTCNSFKNDRHLGAQYSVSLAQTMFHNYIQKGLNFKARNIILKCVCLSDISDPIK